MVKTKSLELETVVVPGESVKEKGLSFILMFVAGFAGFSLLGAIVMIILLALGVLPAV